MLSLRKLILITPILFLSQPAWGQTGVFSQNYSCQDLTQIINKNGKMVIRYDQSKASLFQLVYSRSKPFSCRRNASSNYCDRFVVPTNDNELCKIGLIEVFAPQHGDEEEESQIVSRDKYKNKHRGKYKNKSRKKHKNRPRNKNKKRPPQQPVQP